MSDDLHNPLEKVLMREFLSNIVIIGYKLYKEHVNRDGPKGDKKKSPVLGQCLQKLLDENINDYSCSVNGYFMREPRYASVALGYMEKCLEIYKTLCAANASHAESNGSLTMRQFMFFLQDLKIVGSNLTAKSILTVLSSDNPAVNKGDGTANLEISMTFLEFLEALVGCSLYFTTKQEREDAGNIPVSRPISAASRAESQKSMKQCSSLQVASHEEEVHFSESQRSQHQNLSNQDVKSNLDNEFSSKNTMKTSSQQPSGGFLQTLSQLSVRDHDDNLTSIGDAASHYADSMGLQADNDETDEDHNFRIWTDKLNTFFKKVLYPAWDFSESLKEAMEKNRIERVEKERLENLQRDANKRLQSFQDKEEKEMASPRVMEEEENLEECGSQVHSISQESVVIPEEPVRSTSSVKGKGKSGKKRK